MRSPQCDDLVYSFHSAVQRVISVLHRLFPVYKNARIIETQLNFTYFLISFSCFRDKI